MRVVLTGATGLIGRALTRLLVTAGHDITILTRRPHRAAQAFGNSLRSYEWHPISEPVPAEALTGVETLIHLMGDPIDGAATPKGIARLTASRVTSLNRLIAALGDQTPRFIQASSCAIYPSNNRPPKLASGKTHDPAIGYDEASEIVPTGCDLQQSVLDWEAAAQPLMSAGAKVAQVRLGMVVDAKAFPEMLTALHDRRLRISLSPGHMIPAITRPDAAALFAWLVDNPNITGPVNGVAPTALTGQAVNTALATAQGGHHSWPLPSWLASRTLGMIAPMLLGHAPVQPKCALEQGFMFSNPDVTKALQAAKTAQLQKLQVARSEQLEPWLRERGEHQLSVR